MPFNRIDKSYYSESLASAYKKVFSGNDIDDQPFTNINWRCVIVPGGRYMSDEHLKALCDTAKHIGDKSIVLCIKDALPEYFPACYENDIVEDSSPIIPNDAIVCNQLQIFSKSANWGLVDHWEGVAILASNDSFISRFLARVGGQETLISEFRENKFCVGYGDEGRLFRAALEKMAGWDDIP